jgi:hypothetical protein
MCASAAGTVAHAAETTVAGDRVVVVLTWHFSGVVGVQDHPARSVFLFQRGSSESKDPDAREEVDDDPQAARHQPDTPWPVQRGGLVLKLYEHSLSLALLALFVFSFTMHAIGGTWAYNEEQLAQGGQTEAVW